MSVLLWCLLIVCVVAAVRGTWSPCGLSMVSAINPLAEHARGHRYGWTCAWFLAGSSAGGALLGVCAALPAAVVARLAPPDIAVLLVAAAAALAALLLDSGATGVRPPFYPRQVDERWLDTYRRWLYASGFGLQIGAGLATYVMTAANGLLVVLAALTGRPGLALLAGLLFGVVRGAAVLLTARVRTPQHLYALHRRLEVLAPASVAVVMAVEAAVLVALVVAAVGPVAAGLVLVVLAVVGPLVHRRTRPLPAPAKELAPTR